MARQEANALNVLAEFTTSKGAAQEEIAAWDLRSAAADAAPSALPPHVQVVAAKGDQKAFLEAQSAADEQAGAILVGIKDSACDACALYRQILADGLLQRRGLLLLEGLDQAQGSSKSAALLAQMVQLDAASGLIAVLSDKAAKGTTVVQITDRWLPGVPMPSMSLPLLSAEKDSEEVAPEGLKRRKAEKADAAPQAPATAAASPRGRSIADGMRARARTLAAICFLWACAPLLGLLALAAWLRHKVFGPSFQTTEPKKQLRILVTGGKMSKASAVARAVGRDGHKVFTAEIMPYKYCHTRFCSYVSKHYVLPRPTVDPVAWEAAVQSIVAEQSIDLIIPCTAPVESSAYAHLRERLPANVRVFAFDGEVSDELDNKYTFNQVLVKAGLQSPETAAMECLEDGLEFFRNKKPQDGGKKYLVKPAVYDPKARTEILFLPIEDTKRQEEYLRSRNATKAVPYVIQEVLENPEYGCFAMFNQGALTGFEFFESAASCLVYRQCRDKRYQQVLELNKGLGKAMNLTGQLTLDLMHTASGDMVPIECNPRIHSAICTLEGHRNLGASYTDPAYVPAGDEQIVTSKPDTFRYREDMLRLLRTFRKSDMAVKISDIEPILQILSLNSLFSTKPPRETAALDPGFMIYRGVAGVNVPATFGERLTQAGELNQVNVVPHAWRGGSVSLGSHDFLQQQDGFRPSSVPDGGYIVFPRLWVRITCSSWSHREKRTSKSTTGLSRHSISGPIGGEGSAWDTVPSGLLSAMPCVNESASSCPPEKAPATLKTMQSQDARRAYGGLSEDDWEIGRKLARPGSAVPNLSDNEKIDHKVVCAVISGHMRHGIRIGQHERSSIYAIEELYGQCEEVSVGGSPTEVEFELQLTVQAPSHCGICRCALAVLPSDGARGAPPDRPPEPLLEVSFDASAEEHLHFYISSTFFDSNSSYSIALNWVLRPGMELR